MVDSLAQEVESLKTKEASTLKEIEALKSELAASKEELA